MVVKRKSFLLVFTLVCTLFLISFVSSETVFSDGFESGSIDTNNWSLSGAGAAWTITSVATFPGPESGTYYINAGNTDGESIISKNISTSGYTNINFSFNYTSDGPDAGEYVAADWYNGTAWINLLNTSTDYANVWQGVNYQLPSGADNNPNFQIRFRASSSNPNEDFYVDNVLISADARPTIRIVYPQNNSIYNSPSLFIRSNITGGSLDTCWYDLNGVNTTFACGVEPTLTATEGQNNLTVYVNNTLGYASQDSINFSVNSSIPLVVSITSPENNTQSTSTTPRIKLLAFNNQYSSINYTTSIYYSNGTLYSAGNYGTLTNNTETEITLSPALTLLGSITSYDVVVNATDAGGNNASAKIRYVVTLPAVTLISPTNNYFDADGSISFNFKVLDLSYSNVSCSLYLNDVLTQTNNQTFSNDTVTTFDVNGIEEGANMTWRVTCTDASNNVGTDSRTFSVDKTPPSLTLTSVAGDTSPSYYDSVNDGITNITFEGEGSMSCRWASVDVPYSSMTSDCTVSGTNATCPVTNVAAEGFHNRYVSCQDFLGNDQNSTQNLDVSFYLDYTAPTTSDDSDTSFHAPNYTVTITEIDNVDGDPTTYYCVDTSGTCTPSTLIDDGGTIIFTSSNRGRNYLRYYSVDDAGFNQTIANKTININQLPILTSAQDNATTIRGGGLVNVSTISSDLDNTQSLTLFVCGTDSATSSGCTVSEYCQASATENVSCTFNSESDSATHNWYAFIFDGSGEAATNNSITGSYTTDSTSPSLTVDSPTNTTYTQQEITFTITSDETLSGAWYSVNGGSNITLTNTSLVIWTNTNSSVSNGGYNVTFYGNDSYGNLGVSSTVYFTVDAGSGDTTPPTISVWSPTNNTYFTSSNILLNISMNENISWAGYTNNSGTLTTLDNYTLKNWNSTVTFQEGEHLIIFYANDTSDNQGNESITFYVDLTNPSVDSFICDSSVNSSDDVICNASISDAVGLDYAIVSYNATGSFVNSSSIALSGTSDSLNYTILSGNTSVPGFSTILYLFDLSGRVNSSTYDVVVLDNTAPQIDNISYSPNTSADLDPLVNVSINATITEDYNISTVVLMYRNSSTVSWSYLTMSNNSALVQNGASTIVYNATLNNLDNETWYFKVNSTDNSGNNNVSAEYSFVVENDISQSISTTVPDVKSITYAQRSSNNSLGSLILNNTGDGSLIYNVSLISSTLSDRLSINYTGNNSKNYTVLTNDFANLTLDINTTGLGVGLYDYNISVVSEAGTQTYEKQINIQTSTGAYLDVSINTYSSSVSAGDSGIDFSVTVTNLGTADATDVYLNWSLPSEFSIDSGSQIRYLGNIPISGQGQNSIIVSVSSGATDKNVTISSTANSSNADSATDSKTVTIGTPTTTTTVVTGRGGGSSGGGGSGAIVYDKTIKVVRGEKDTFEIDVYNKNSNASLEDLTIRLDGFLTQYISLNSSTIDFIGPKEIGSFVVFLEAPSYTESYEEHTLKATIIGVLNIGGKTQSYSEIQNILLIIEEVNSSFAIGSLNKSFIAIEEMNNSGFNVNYVQELYSQATLKIKDNRNKESYDLSQEIIEIRDLSFEVNNLIRRIFEVEQNPRRLNLLVGDVSKEFRSDYSEYSLGELLEQDSGFMSQSTRDTLNLAIVAFERGEYELANERAKAVQSMVLLETKGNFGLFILLNWKYLLLAFLALSFFSIFAYRRHQQNSILYRIEDINNEEVNIHKLIEKTQKDYFGSKISKTQHDAILAQHQKKMANLKKERLTLRNRRIKMLKPEQISKELKLEMMQTESEIKNIQKAFFVTRKMSEHEYKLQFKTLNERLAEIEDERATTELMKKRVKR